MSVNIGKSLELTESTDTIKLNGDVGASGQMLISGGVGTVPIWRVLVSTDIPLPLQLGSVNFGTLYTEQVSLGVVGQTAGFVVGTSSSNYAAFNWNDSVGGKLTVNGGGLGAVDVVTFARTYFNTTVPLVVGSANFIGQYTSQITIGVSGATSGIVCGESANNYGAFSWNNTTGQVNVGVNSGGSGFSTMIVISRTGITLGSTTSPVGTLFIPVAAPTTSNYGLLSLGAGPFDGTTSGFFPGNSNGTHIAINAASGFAGRTIDSRIFGVRQFALGLGTVVSATSATLNGIDIAPFTYTISGSTAITTATGFNAVQIGIPTYTAASAVAITIGATFTIAGAPAVAGSATLTTPLAVWVQAGTSRFDGNLMLSSDNTIQRIGAHSLQFGAANSASPVSYTLTGGESARGGTDTNTAGGSLTIASGLGTGTGALASLSLASPIAAASGTTAQTYAIGLKILVGTAVLTNYIVANLPAAATAGTGATAFVTDGSTTVILGLGQAVTGGGSNKVPVYSDGTNWIIG